MKIYEAFVSKTCLSYFSFPPQSKLSEETVHYSVCQIYQAIDRSVFYLNGHIMLKERQTPQNRVFEFDLSSNLNILSLTGVNITC